MMGAVFLFFHELPVLLLAAFFGACVGPGIFRRSLAEKRMKAQRKELTEALIHLVVSLRTGRSLEGAWEASLQDMDPQLFPEIYPLWREAAEEMRLGFPAELSLRHLADKVSIPELGTLARTVDICKRTQGDLKTVLEAAIHQLQDRMDMQAELKVLLARKKSEQKIMSVMPVVIIALLLLLSPGYLEPLYRSGEGHLVMLFSAALCLLSFWLSARITRIEL